MRLGALFSAVLTALTLGSIARAQEDVWDPSADEGVPQEELFDAADQGEAPAGARVSKSRRPVRSDEPMVVETSDEGLEPAPEEAEVARPRRARGKRPAAAAPEPARAEAAPPVEGQQFGSRRVQVFLVPVGSSASQAAGPVQLALEGETRRLPGFRPVDLVEALQVPPTPEDRKRMENARRALTDGNKLLVGHDYGEAANRFKRAIRFMEDAHDALEAWEYSDAWARLGVAFSLSGEDGKAQECFKMAARADLSNQVDGVQIDRKVGGALESARDEVASGPTGALSVVTQLDGARVFLGGVYKGMTPVTIDRAPAGLNLVRIDRPGSYPEVRIVEVKEAFDTPLRVKLKFTPEALELQRTLQQVPRALDRAEGVPDMISGLGRRFKLERAVIATVEMDKVGVAKVRMAVFDLARTVRLADEVSLFALDVEGGLQEAVAKWARMVFDKGDGSRDRAANDPLDRSDGTEGWYSAGEARSKTVKARLEEEDEDLPEWERSNYKPTTYRDGDVKSADPLDHGDGTEDW